MSGHHSRALFLGLMWSGLATAVAVFVCVMWIDVPLAQFMNAHHDTVWVSFFQRITNFANGVIWYSIAVVGILAAFLRRRLAPAVTSPEDLKRRVRAWLFMILAMATSGIVLNIIKVMIGRQRPRMLFRDDLSGFHPFTVNVDASSFPSGHTQSICSAMLSLAFIFPPARPIFAVVALLIATSRVIIAVHYLSDVLAGAYLGIAAVLLWRAWFERHGLSVNIARPKVPSSAPAGTPPPPAPSN